MLMRRNIWEQLHIIVSVMLCSVKNTLQYVEEQVRNSYIIQMSDGKEVDIVNG